MTVYTAIIGRYDDLKEPFVITPGWKYICFTDQNLKSDVWEIRKVEVDDELGPAKTARYYKIMFHKHIQDEFSMWVDATFFINCNLDEWWKQFLPPFTTIFHPFDRCVYKEIASCLRGGKGDPVTLRNQHRAYQKIGLKPETGLIASGILMRQRRPETIQFCNHWWKQVEMWTERDQIAFAFTDFKMPERHQSIRWDYTQQKEFIHIPHLHKTWRFGKLNEVQKFYGGNKTS
jgi:hypothetical protein